MVENRAALKEKSKGDTALAVEQDWTQQKTQVSHQQRESGGQDGAQGLDEAVRRRGPLQLTRAGREAL